MASDNYSHGSVSQLGWFCWPRLGEPCFMHFYSGTQGNDNWQRHKRASRNTQSFLSLDTEVTQWHCYPILLTKSQEARKYISALLVGVTAKYQGKGCGYRKGWRTGASDAIYHIMYHLISHVFVRLHCLLISYCMLVETMFHSQLYPRWLELRLNIRYLIMLNGQIHHPCTQLLNMPTICQPGAVLDANDAMVNKAHGKCPQGNI